MTPNIERVSDYPGPCPSQLVMLGVLVDGPKSGTWCNGRHGKGRFQITNCISTYFRSLSDEAARDISVLQV